MSDKEIEGKMDQAKGKVKEGYGKVTGDKSTEAEGKADQAKGKVKEAFGEAKRKIKNALDSDEK
ncbi:general stress protein CsbD [Nonlabens sp. YIK11]|uniref:CsbD family protein n=1 Tax=Nonlabens sp. YIK11 TaxID=1453349 RepID=UPI0006DCD937|nr:CsbD family protein [Nonlabens sp. YIK11]KQC34605.1 general stress protein CsbD [Nonlabens sp. YIK11]